MNAIDKLTEEQKIEVLTPFLKLFEAPVNITLTTTLNNVMQNYIDNNDEHADEVMIVASDMSVINMVISESKTKIIEYLGEDK